mgnify:CR=1 FL=1
MRRRNAIAEFKITAEHADEMFFQTHHQWVHKCVEEHIGALKTHLRGIARRKILHVHRCGDHGAGDRQPLGDMAFHLRAENKFRLRINDGLFFGFVNYYLSVY